MRKIAYFDWSVSVEVREDFDPENPEHVRAARDEAWLNVHNSNGYLDGVADEPADLTPQSSTQSYPVL